MALIITLHLFFWSIDIVVDSYFGGFMIAPISITIASIIANITILTTATMPSCGLAWVKHRKRAAMTCAGSPQ